MSGAPFRTVSVLAVVAVAFAARVAAAAPCGQPDVDDTFPPHESEDVPANATLSAHYSAPADYDDEAVTLTGPAGDVPVEVLYDTAESMLRAAPRAELAAGAYELMWPALRGVGESRGRGRTVTFSVGAARDTEAPRFSGLTRLTWDLSREQDPCTDSLEDRFWFELGLGAATDDAPASLLAVVVFETRGGNKTGSSAPEQIGVVPLPEKGVVRVERQAIGDETVCFAAVTRDLANRVSGGGDEEVCVQTTAPPFFDGCAMARPSRRTDAFGLVGVLGFLLFSRRRGARHA
ncbi:MAG TPA: hypothetical protein VFZ53_32205 [Polyangiaceae bacterium]